MRQSSLIILIIVIIVIIVAVRENLICTKSHIWDFVRQNGVTFVIIVIIIIIIIYRKSKSINTLAPMHYRLRVIRGGPFTSHFTVIKIFQILFLPSVSFYTHPNISDIFVGDEINLFNLTFHDITNY